MRDTLPNKPNKNKCGVINMDEYKGIENAGGVAITECSRCCQTLKHLVYFKLFQAVGS